jgi:hypothetical protein
MDSGPGVKAGKAGTGAGGMPNDQLRKRAGHSTRSGRPDLNRGPPAPEAGALTGLRYAPQLRQTVNGKTVNGAVNSRVT